MASNQKKPTHVHTGGARGSTYSPRTGKVYKKGNAKTPQKQSKIETAQAIRSSYKNYKPSPPVIDFDRAFDYPYERPHGSFLFTPGAKTRLLKPHEIAKVCEGRRPVLAIGSNAAPVQLHRKFGNRNLQLSSIPVITAKLKDFDVVYSAHVAPYGSIPATICKSAGTEIEVHMTYLTQAQLRIMDQTEALGVAYEKMEIDTKLITTDGPLGKKPVPAYRSLDGELAIDGDLYAIQDIPATGRLLPAINQYGIIEKVSKTLGMNPKDFVAEVTGSPRFSWAIENHVNKMALGYKEPQRSLPSRRLNDYGLSSKPYLYNEDCKFDEFDEREPTKEELEELEGVSIPSEFITDTWDESYDNQWEKEMFEKWDRENSL